MSDEQAQKTQAQPGQIKDIGELWQTVEQIAGVKLGELPILTKYLWFPTPQSGGREPTIIEMGAGETGEPREIPLKPGFIVFAMFHDENEVRVYALAKSAQDAQGRPNPPHRLILSKHAPIIGVEIMALDVFIDEVVDELVAIGGEPGGPEGEEEEEEEEEDEADGKTATPARPHVVQPE